MLPYFGLDDDLDIAAKRGEKTHQPFNRESAQSAAYEARDMRLFYPQNRSGMCLSEPTL